MKTTVLTAAFILSCLAAAAQENRADWSKRHNINLDDPAAAAGDADGDKLSNLQEFQQGTDPHKADTDGDGAIDGHDNWPLDKDRWGGDLQRNIDLSEELAKAAVGGGGVSSAPDKIKIFDLAAIRSIPLDPEILAVNEKGGTVVEELMYTGAEGVRVYAMLSYPKGARSLKTHLEILNVGAMSRDYTDQVHFSACNPTGNMAADGKQSVGPKNFAQGFAADPKQSWTYNTVVALTRGIDYLLTRPEVDPKRIYATGYSWSGLFSAMLHAVDSRPVSYLSWAGCGFGADDRNMNQAALEAYSPSTYGRFGRAPILIEQPSNDFFSDMGACIQLLRTLECPFAVRLDVNQSHTSVPGRDPGPTRKLWFAATLDAAVALPLVRPVEARNASGKLTAAFSWTSPDLEAEYAEIAYSYGEPGHWKGRAWHLAKATLDGESAAAEIPIYEAGEIVLFGSVRFESGAWLSGIPIVVSTESLGLRPTAKFNGLLSDFDGAGIEYFQNGAGIGYSGGAAQGAACVKFRLEARSGGAATCMFRNVDGRFWRDFNALSLCMKGAHSGTLRIYLVEDIGAYHWMHQKTLAKANLHALAVEGLAEDWRRFDFPFEDFGEMNFNRLDALVFELEGGEADIWVDDIALRR